MSFTTSSDQRLRPVPRHDAIQCRPGMVRHWAAQRAGQRPRPIRAAAGNTPEQVPIAEEPGPGDGDQPARGMWRVPRYSLRTVFVAMAVLCGLLALATTITTLWLVLLVWLSLMITAHVGGNLSGSSALRGDRSMDEGPAFISPRVVAAPSTHLREKANFGRAMVIFTVTSAAVGALVVLAYLIFGLKHRPPLLGLLIGGVSAAVIAGQVGFLAGSFVNVFRTAFRQASGMHPPPQPRLGGGTGSAE